MGGPRSLACETSCILIGLVSQTQIRTSPGLKSILNGESLLNVLLCPGIGLIYVWETGPRYSTCFVDKAIYLAVVSLYKIYRENIGRGIYI